jgi:hypothetical protein
VLNSLNFTCYIDIFFKFYNKLSISFKHMLVIEVENRYNRHMCRAPTLNVQLLPGIYKMHEESIHTIPSYRAVPRSV